MRTKIINMDGIDYTIEASENSTKIYDSWQLNTYEKRIWLIQLICIMFIRPFGDRTIGSIEREIRAHNALYKRHIKVDHTKDADIEHHLKWYYAVGFFFVNLFFKD